MIILQGIRNHKIGSYLGPYSSRYKWDSTYTSCLKESPDGSWGLEGVTLGVLLHFLGCAKLLLHVVGLVVELLPTSSEDYYTYHLHSGTDRPLLTTHEPPSI